MVAETGGARQELHRRQQEGVPGGYAGLNRPARCRVPSSREETVRSGSVVGHVIAPLTVPHFCGEHGLKHERDDDGTKKDEEGGPSDRLVHAQNSQLGCWSMFSTSGPRGLRKPGVIGYAAGMIVRGVAGL